MQKMLGDITNHVVNFRALNEVIKKPEVANDYRDLDYADKLLFIDGVEPPLKDVTQVLERAKDLIDKIDADFKAIPDKP